MNEWKNEWMSFVKALIVAVVCLTAVRLFLFTPVVVDGASMLPTFENGDRVIVSKQSTIEHFDVIVFQVSGNTNYIKRVIGLPGDRLVYKEDKLYINENTYEEPYLDHFKHNIPLDTYLTENFTLEKYTGYEMIPEGYVFVLGDNRPKSMDSRDPSLGLVSMDSILGEVELVVYPFSNVKIVQ